MLTLACAFLACTQPFPTAPDDALLLAQGNGEVTVAYYCGNTFQFRNRSLDTLTLQWRVHGVQENGQIFLPGRGGAEYSETYLTTVERGPLQVLRGGRVTQTVPNRHTAQCNPPAAEVPMTAPDTFPAWIEADSSIGADGMTKGIVLVVFRPTATQAERNAAAVATGGVLIGGDPSPLGYEGFYIFQLRAPAALANPDSIVILLRQMPGVESALREYRGTTPNWSRPHDGIGWQPVDWSVLPAAAGGQNWALEAMRLPLAWGCGIGSPLAKVGLIDHEFDPTEFRSNTIDDNGVFGRSLRSGPHHGTMMGNFLAARGGDSVGMTGTSQRAGLVLRDIGTYAPSVRQVQKAIEQMVAAKVKIVNLSYSFRVPYMGAAGPIYPHRGDPNAINFVNGQLSPLFKRLRRIEQDKPLPLIVLSAGNDAYDAYFSGYPVLRDSFPGNVLVVGAASTTLMDTWGASATGPNSGSNVGDFVDLYAPGEAVYTYKDATPTLAPSSGTSNAAALVSGLLALALAQDTSLTAKELRVLLMAAAGDRAVAVPHGRSFGGGAFVPDAYGLLRQVARRPGTPLCGNRLWNEGTQVFAARGPGGREMIADLGTAPAGYLLPFHGGRKVVVQNADTWDYTLYELQGATWVSLGEWDWDDSEVGGSGLTLFGVTHDRDSVVFISGSALYIGKRFNQRDRKITDLTTEAQQSGGELCVREVKASTGWECTETAWFGTTESSSWQGGASPVGDSVVYLRKRYRRSTSSRLGAVDCDTGGPVTDPSICRRYTSSSSTAELKGEVVRVERGSGARTPILALPGRFLASVAGSEDGGSLVVASEVWNGSGPVADCRTDFYSLASPAAPSLEASYPYGDVCFGLDWQGGFGAVRADLAQTPEPSHRGFALQSRLLRAAGR